MLGGGVEDEYGQNMLEKILQESIKRHLKRRIK